MRQDITASVKVVAAGRGAVASVEERKQILTDIMRVSFAAPSIVKPGHIIGAIDTLNRMEGLYAVPFGFSDNRVINILCDQDTAGLIGQIKDRTKLLTAGSKPQPIVSDDAVQTTDSMPA